MQCASAHTHVHSRSQPPSLRTEFRGDRFDPTTVLVIRVDTIERRIRRARGVGYAVLNLFCVPGESRWSFPSSSAQSDYVLNEGAFQLPLHQGPPSSVSAGWRAGTFARTLGPRARARSRARPPQVDTLTLHSLDAKKRVPAATILVRVRRAPRSRDGVRTLSTADVPESGWKGVGLMVPPPAYSSGEYDSSRAQPGESEALVYRAVKGRAKTVVREVLGEGAARRCDRAVRARALTRPAVPAADAGKSPPEDADDEATSSWVVARFSGPVREMITYKRIVSYAPASGFRVQLEGVYNLPFKKVCGVIMSLAPPAAYYDGGDPSEVGAGRGRGRVRSCSPSRARPAAPHARLRLGVRAEAPALQRPARGACAAAPHHHHHCLTPQLAADL